MRDDLLLDELGREGIERAIGDAVEGEEDGCCHHLDAELSVDEDDPDWEAAELVEWRVVEPRKAGAFLVALVEGEVPARASERGPLGSHLHPGPGARCRARRICVVGAGSAIRSSQRPSSAGFRGPVVGAAAAKELDRVVRAIHDLAQPVL